MSIAALRICWLLQEQDLPSADALKASVRAIWKIERDAERRRWFGFWNEEMKAGHTSAFMWACTGAREREGYVVDEKMLSNSKQYLRDIEKRIPRITASMRSGR